MSVERLKISDYREDLEIEKDFEPFSSLRDSGSPAPSNESVTNEDLFRVIAATEEETDE